MGLLAIYCLNCGLATRSHKVETQNFPLSQCTSDSWRTWFPYPPKESVCLKTWAQNDYWLNFTQKSMLNMHPSENRLKYFFSGSLVIQHIIETYPSGYLVVFSNTSKILKHILSIQSSSAMSNKKHLLAPANRQPPKNVSAQVSIPVFYLAGKA